MAKASADRWQSAQSYEQRFWDGQSKLVAQEGTDGINWYGWRAKHLISCLEEVGLGHLAKGDSNLIEVGSGPVGVVTHIPGKTRVAVDPLGDFYSDRPELTTHRDPTVDYIAGVGEKLDVPDDTFDLAITENCIDHVQDTDAVMGELHRALRPNGILYLTVNVRTVWGYWVHRLLSNLRIDVGHPHTFRASSVRKLMSRNNFAVMTSSGSSLLKARLAQITGQGWRERLKGLAGVTESELFVVARATAK